MSNTDTELYRSLGRIEGKIDELSGQVEQQNQQIEELKKDVEDINKQAARWKGGFHVILGLSPFIVGLAVLWKTIASFVTKGVS